MTKRARGFGVVVRKGALAATLSSATFAAAMLAGCSGASEGATEAELGTTQQAYGSPAPNGERLFERETFGGNGRTCSTCHLEESGTVSPRDAQREYRRNPRGPLFRSIDSDDGVGNNYAKLLADATIRVTLKLPTGWSLQDDPTATTVTFRRGISTTLNVPSLDTIFMADGRNDSVQGQALGAINAHYQPLRQPTTAELDAIAAHEKTNDFFSDGALRRYARGGAAPTLPAGRTASQQRGRNWFVPSASGVCGHCHAGPMLNQTSQFLLAPLPPGSRFFTAFVSELNKAGNPVHTFVVRNADGTTQNIASPDPGRALITGNPADANSFRIPTLWGVKNTAPYFHDNSAKDFAQLTAHYSDYFQIIGLPALTAQEQADINAYLELL